MRIQYQVECLDKANRKQGAIVINGKLIYWGTLMSFSHLRDYNARPLKRTNVWLYAKKRMKAAKQQLRSGSLPPKTLRLLSFLALSKEYNTDVLMEFLPCRGWPNQYAAISTDPARDDCYNFSVHTKYPYRTSIQHMSPISQGQNLFFDVYYDYSNHTLVLHDPINQNDILDCEPERYVQICYQRLIDDLNKLDSRAEMIVVGNARYITKHIAEGIRVGLEMNLYKTGYNQEFCVESYEEGNVFCKSGILIQIDEDDRVFEMD